MVGIVVVSHSAKLAEGVVELARQMGGGEVALKAVGGLDDPADPIGTDALSIKEAIESVWTPEGVLVLMDLGSAVLNAETALELLEPPAQAQRVMLCDAPLVEGAVAAAAAAGVGASLQEVAAEARSGLAPKTEHLGGTGTPSPSTPAHSESETREFTITNRLGLHLRPAARLVETLGRFQAAVEVTNATTGAGPAPGRSLSRISALGIRQGHLMRLAASGPDTEGVFEAVERLVADTFGEEEGEAAGQTVPSAPSLTDPGEHVGVAASPGMALGPARRLERAPVPVPSVPSRPPEEERARLSAAIAAGRLEVVAQRETTLRRAGPASADIFSAHLLILDDADLVQAAISAVDHQTGAEAAWKAAVDAAADELRRLDDPYQAARAEDIEAVGRLVLAHLTGVDPSPRLLAAGVLVADDLTPGETAALNPDLVSAIVTRRGAPTSHSAIIARALGVPAVVGTATLAVDEGRLLLVDGYAGRVWVDPDPDRVRAAEARIAADAARRRQAQERAHAPAVTVDGTTIEVAANIGSVAEAETAVRSGADGVGLLRTEFLYLNRSQPPDEEEESRTYRRILEALGERPVVLRTLDVGGDKSLPFLDLTPEENPFLGVRGIRLGLARPDLARSQLRAALSAAAGRHLRLMFPMVAVLDEWRRARALVEEAAREVSDGPSRLEVGVMVEVPSVALAADTFARHVDFFSVGTNDLTQYTLAAERGNPDLTGLADGLHPSVLALIDSTCRAALRHGRWVGVCGELAGDPVAIPVLLGLGVTELSMNPAAIPGVKEVVRRVDLPSARSLASRVLGLSSAEEVRSESSAFVR